MGLAAPTSSSSPGYPTPARPAAKTWQEQQSYDAQDYWQNQGETTQAGEAAAGGRRDTAQAGADAAVAAFASTKPTNTEAWSPAATAGYQPSQVAAWKASMDSLRAATPNFSSVGGVGGVGGGAPGGGGGAGSMARSFDASALTDFDPSAAGTTFAKGAYGDFERNLKTNLTSLENRSVGQGRLKTGFFDTDQGNIVKSNAKTFDDTLAQAALGFSGQRLQALQGGKSLELSRDQGIDANSLTASAQAQTAAEAARQDELRANEDVNQFNLSKYSTGLAGAEFQDTQNYGRARALDTDTYGRARALDTQALGQAQTGLEAALQRESEYNKESDVANDRADSFASANRGWAAADRQTQDQRDEAERLRRLNDPSYGNPNYRAGGGNVSPTAQDDPYGLRAQAKALGVPYRG